MDRDLLRELLEAHRRGDVTTEEVLERLARLPYADVEHARVDTHRALRQGFAEVIYAPGKTAAQIERIARTLRDAGQRVLVTRASAELAEALRDRIPGARYDADGRLLAFRRVVPEGLENIVTLGAVLVISAGTADLPVAAEAAGVARFFGNRVESLQDVGVAGIHRLLGEGERLRAARVLIVVAGMEGALPSVVGGLVDRPVLAVPTSVGYGASFGGLAALLGMLNSCASNVAVLNIDNGFGAAYVASLINRL